MKPFIFVAERNAIGLGYMAAAVADALSTHCEPTLVCPTPFGGYVRSNVRVIEIDFPPHKYQPTYFTKMAKVVSMMRKEKASVVHFIDEAPTVSLFMPFINFCPLAQVWHDITPHPGDTIKHLWLTRGISSRRLSAILVHGDRLKSDLISRYPHLESKAFVIPHGTTTVHTELPDAEQVQEEDNVLLFGRIREYKGVDIFLKAAMLIHEKMPHVTFTIAGEGDMTPYVDLLEQTKDYVEVDNRTIPHEVVPKLFARARVVSLPYIEGSASGVLSVSHGFGKPAVTTALGSINESVVNEVTDLIIPPRDPAALADATIRLLTDSNLRNKLSRGIHEKVRAELSYDKVAVQLIQIYEELIRRRKGRSSV